MKFAEKGDLNITIQKEKKKNPSCNSLTIFSVKTSNWKNPIKSITHLNQYCVIITIKALFSFMSNLNHLLTTIKAHYFFSYTKPVAEKSSFI